MELHTSNMQMLFTKLRIYY